MMKISELSENGSRIVNEDYLGKTEKNHIWCFALADGLGGEGKGELASSTAIHTVLTYFEEHGELTRACMEQCFERAQEEILNKQKELGLEWGMKTTLVLLFADEEEAIWGYSGDSRLYFFGKETKPVHTLDHSVPQMLVALGEIQDKDIRGHEDRSRLLKALGIEWTTKGYSISEKIKTEAGDRFLLCSDGFWEEIEDETMQELSITHADTEEWLRSMEACLAGKQGLDNYSAIAVEIEERGEEKWQ